MSQTDTYGFYSNPNERQGRSLPLDSTTGTIEVNDMLTEATAGYLKKVTATSDVVYGVAMERSTAPSADGEKSIRVDISPDSIYRFPPDAGTVTEALKMRMCDVGADGRSANIDASSVDCLLIVDVDTVENVVFVKIRPSYTGVV